MQKLLLGSLLVLSACSRQQLTLTTPFNNEATPPAPTYANPDHWAALPTKTDAADQLPQKSNLQDGQATAQADVFFIYPTIFTEKPTNQYVWNADVNDPALNKQIDESTITNQATAFNGSCRVFAPRYRQAHLFAFYTKDKDAAKQSFEVAYADVKAAFEYYLTHYNQGRPIVIASHSQGTVHARKLMKDFFDGKPLQNQLVAAYLIGIAVPPSEFSNIKPISKPGEIGTWMSWNTYARDFYPPSYQEGLSKALCINPLTWSSSPEFVSKEQNKGGVGLKFTFVPQIVDAQVHEGMLWINKPYVAGRALVRTKVWHRADINFFYMNIRENVDLQVRNYLNRQSPAAVTGAKKD